MRHISGTHYAVMTVLSILGAEDAFSDSPGNDAADTGQTVCQQACVPECAPMCAFGRGCCDLAPERCNNLWISGDYLYWRVCEDGFSCEFGDTTINTNIVGSKPTTAILEHDKDINFEWAPGVRVGIGIDWPCSGWDIALYGTYYGGEGDGHDLHNYADWWVHFNVADAIIGRKFWVGRCVDLRPFAGMRYAQISQRLRTNLTTNIISATGTSITKTTIKDKQKFWGLGPELGLEADFYFGCGWSLYGTLDGAVLYGHTKTSFDDIDSFVLTNNTCNATGESCDIQWVLDLGLGIRWEFRHLTLQAGVEHHNYFDYNAIGCCGDLNLFGGNVSVAVHF